MVFLLLQPSWLKYHKKHRFQGDTSPRKRDTWKRLKPNLHLGMCSLPLSGCQLVLLYMMVTSNLASSMINLFPPYQVMLQCWIVSLCSLSVWETQPWHLDSHLCHSVLESQWDYQTCLQNPKSYFQAHYCCFQDPMSLPDTVCCHPLLSFTLSTLSSSYFSKENCPFF